ncbi:MAG: hypothetical protein IJ109_07965 [Firmicutes bacterium]|nr:hypothetical protein [Bacillota bacterium]
MQFQAGTENEQLLSRIENSIEEGRVSHAYIIEGPEHMDKPAFARAFAKGILCPQRRGDHCGSCAVCDKIDHDNHEDLICLQRLKTRQSLGIEQIKQMQAQISIKPNGPRYIVIIEESDRMTEEAQNCLLKTLEEPPGDAVLMLLSENSEQLLATIRSRCIKYRLEGSREVREEEISRRANEVLRGLLDGSPFYRIRKTLGEVGRDRQEAIRLIDGMQERCRELILSRDGNGVPYSAEEIGNCVYALEDARRQLTQGMTPAYVLKRFILSVGG